jgi:hypothetical protein
MTAASDTPGRPGELLVLDLSNAVPSATLTVRVASSRPVVDGGTVRHALSLTVLDGPHIEAKDAWGGSTKVGLTGSEGLLIVGAASVLAVDLNNSTVCNDVVGVLSRELAVRALNLSGSGCLLESDRRLEPGTTATLRLTIRGEEFSDPVRVTWCRRIAGAGETWRSGAEFLWAEAPHRHSLRRALKQVQRHDLRSGVDIGVGPTRLM